MCAPSGITDVEKRAIVEASLSAGARRVHLIEEPIAAAIGAGIAIEEPVGNMVVDVGGGTSEVAVISLGGIVVFESVRVGGYDLDEAIIALRQGRARDHDRRSRRAEQIKLEIGSAWPVDDDLTAEVKGRDLVSGLPKTVHADRRGGARGARGAARARSSRRSRTRSSARPRSSPPTSAQRGIMLAGGGSLLQGFDRRVRESRPKMADAPRGRRRSPAS